MKITPHFPPTVTFTLLGLALHGCALGFDGPAVQPPDSSSDTRSDTTGDVPGEPSADLPDLEDASDTTIECLAPLVYCEGECVDTTSDPLHCGGCGQDCPEAYQHVEATCAGSTCGTVCEPGWVDNDDLPGCETACAGTGVEACNGLDDDCDGAPDDVYACVLGTDVFCSTTCGSVGTGTCTINCLIPAPLSCDPPLETCNGADDDCDDVIDDGFDPPCIPCDPDCSARECGPDPVCGESCGDCTAPEVCNAAGTCVATCTADCTGRECGPDPVCGESCGSCVPPETCNASGRCVCIPVCSARVCGLDPACGVSCGTCTPPATCNAAGQCICIPDCSTRECGPDPVCGTACGTCTAPDTCNALGECVCIPSCGSRECGPDPVCGLSCGLCTSPETCNGSGTCECVPICAGRECGPDPACGQSCGTCTGTDVCDASGHCVPSCVPDCTGRECGLDPVCGTLDCGSCTSPETCQSGTCACVPDCTASQCGPDPVCGTVDCGTCTFPETCDAAGTCICTPDCSSTYCGPDPVCSQSCGTCPSPQVCTAAGACCTPDCSSVECGPDPVCDVLDCGTCTAPETCQSSGACACIPACTGKECGADGCGGSCGSCLENEVCNAAGTCVCQPWCSELECGPDGCGGSCGTCVSPETCDARGLCTTCSAPFYYTFDSSAEGWTAGGVNSDWARGSPTSGPGAAWGGGGGLWATDLAGDAATCADSWVESPVMDLSPYAGRNVTLVFWTWYEFSPCDFWFVHENYSGAVVEVYSGSSWTYVTPVGGYVGGTLHLSDGTGDPPPCSGLANSIDGRTGFYPRRWNGVWRRVTVDLSSYATSGTRVRLHFGSHAKYACNPYTAGIYVDEVSVVVDPC